MEEQSETNGKPLSYSISGQFTGIRWNPIQCIERPIDVVVGVCEFPIHEETSTCSKVYRRWSVEDTKGALWSSWGASFKEILTVQNDKKRFPSDDVFKISQRDLNLHSFRFQPLEFSERPAGKSSSATSIEPHNAIITPHRVSLGPVLWRTLHSELSMNILALLLTINCWAFSFSSHWTLLSSSSEDCRNLIEAS